MTYSRFSQSLTLQSLVERKKLTSIIPNTYCIEVYFMAILLQEILYLIFLYFLINI
jgi:hypothetical protein